MRKIVFLLVISYSLFIYSQDSLKTVNLENIEIISSPKDVGALNQQPASVTLIHQQQIEQQHITSLKSIGNIVPNFFMPDYGSRLTSAMYIRGVGSRINNPAVGLYVDNIPYVDKSAFDFNFYDVERIDVLRGPQGTLYGRNTMGGLIRIYTKNPFSYQGTDIKLGYATKDNHRNVSLTHYHRISNQFAFSAGGYYEGGDGFFDNDYTGKKADDIQTGGGRIRAIWLPNTKLKLDASASYDYTDEDAYPYYCAKELPSDSSKFEGKITNNRQHNYRRGLLNVGLNLEYQAQKFTLNSITGYQNLNDRMFIDQDFISRDIYTLEQKQKINTISQELIFKSPVNKIQSLNNKDKFKYSWLTGISAFYQTLNTDAPVIFKQDGIKTMIEDNVNSIFTNLKAENPKMPNMGLDVVNEEFDVPNNMKTPIFSAAIFHQSTFTLGRWEIAAGLRLEHEHLKLDYFSDADVDYIFSISMPPYMNKVYDNLKTSPKFEGTLTNDYTQLLPKFTIKYNLGKGTDSKSQIYGSVSKGYRSGGYNIQMFSDIISGEMRNEMIDGVNEVSEGMMARFVDLESIKTKPDINCVIYKPEYSWNYELGIKYNLQNVKFQFSSFFIDTRDQQISRFAESGLGRMMVNAGKSHSFGAELAMNIYNYFNLSYGYTNAKFKEYYDGENDYKDNYVPFIPMHTLNAGIELPIKIKKRNSNDNLCALTFGMNYSGAGRIYWTEANNAYQNFYSTLGAHIAFDFEYIGINLWAKNLTNNRYDTFYFESMNRGFAQLSKPIQFGLDIKVHL